MTESAQKYELLALFPLTGTDDELKSIAVRVEEQLKAAGAAVASNVALQRGRLAYPVSRTRQGSYHLIQFEMDPRKVSELERALTLSGTMLRFTIERRKGEFRPFIATPPKPMQDRRVAAPAFVRRSVPSYSAAMGAPRIGESVAASTVKVGESISKTDAKPAVSMEEIDKRLEEILGE